MKRTSLATLGLVFITFLSAIQYIFLQNVPETVSTFSFLCITNLLGLVILSITQFKKLFSIKKKTLAKGIFFALELTGFNFFLLLGSAHMDSVVISSVVSMYFIFIPPLLLLLRKKVNFFSGIATVIAIIGLLLMFGADTDALFSSIDVVYLFIADIFFASYIVSVSILGSDEDSAQLTIAQMSFAALLALIGWTIESLLGHGVLALPTEPSFWISAVFIGVAIRAVYGLLQITCQKYVPAINASLIFSSEIIITMLINPVMCRIFGTESMKATPFHVIGCVLFIVATLLVDEDIMSRLGFNDVNTDEQINEQGEIVRRSSVAKKMIFSTLTFTMLTLVISTVICLSAIRFIRISAVENSQILGESATQTSSSALTTELETKLLRMTEDKASLAESKLENYSDSTVYAASYASSLYSRPQEYPKREVERAKMENKGIWAMQRQVCRENIDYADLYDESCLLGNMIDVFVPIVQRVPNITTLYLGMQSGLMVSYDPNSDYGYVPGSETYYDYFDLPYYQTCLGLKRGEYVFTDAYQDGFGRGLTITCISPVCDAEGNVIGCMAMDILMNDLNENMVSDGIIDPSIATLIDNEGNIVASKDVPPDSTEVYNIFDPKVGSFLADVGQEILAKKDGIVVTGSGDDAVYIAYATIDSTDWTLCIINPVSSVIQPVNEIRESIDENTQSVVNSVVQSVMNVVQSCLVLIAVTLLAVTFMVGKASRRISDPLKQLEADVREISKGNLDQQTSVRTDDEIGELATSFNSMATALKKHIEELKEVTAREQRIESELAFAADIQLQMLPRVFPAFPERKDFDIYATMNPAKEVGGDFYDFFLVDDDHIALVMADVSGKGVPASLFMVVAKTLIRSRTLMGGTPAEILYDVNNELCKGNDAGLFVTVWLGILDLKTGKGIEANAGHEHPAILRKGGSFELVKNKHSLAVACMEGMRFRQNNFEMHPGDKLYVYTDGVAEATNAQNELYGTDRMLDSLNREKDQPLDAMLRGVRSDIDTFVGEAPQFDDITMLGFAYFGENQA